MYGRFRGSVIFALLAPMVFASGCARSDAYKKDHDMAEETGEGYYSQPSQYRGNPADKLEKIQQPKKKILVLNFWNDTPVGDESLGEFGAEELKRELFTSKRVLFPDTKGVQSATKDFVEGDHVQIAQLIREGRRLGVSSIVVGRISKINFRHDREEVGILREQQSGAMVDLELKVFDVASGREVHSVKKSGIAANTAHVLFDGDATNSKEARSEIAKEALHDAVMKIIPEILLSMDKMDWQGRIAMIQGNKVYVNAGRASGILAGDILKVTSPGEEIVDPVTHSYLGRSEGFLKGTLEVTEFIGEDSSMTLIHTGGNFQEGDVVRLY